MNASATAITKVQAFIVREHARMGTLQRHFGMHMLTVEGRTYDLLSQFCISYDGGYWRFHHLSNGGFYMSPPDGRYEFEVEGNGFRGGMSAGRYGRRSLERRLGFDGTRQSGDWLEIRSAAVLL